MRIWKIEGTELARLLRKFEPGERPIRHARIAVDGDTIKVKVNEYEWSAPFGGLEVDRPEPSNTLDKVEVLHVRDPDEGCHIQVFVNGVKVQHTEEDIDPGRGYTRADWNERIAKYAGDQTPFGQAAHSALVESDDSQYIRGEDETNAERLIELLAEAGIEAESPAHGALFVPIDDTRQIITGYSGWWYGGLEVLRDGMFEPTDNEGLEDFCEESEEDDPAKVAAGIIREVQKLRGQ